jgi:gliding motility-associated-like protein
MKKGLLLGLFVCCSIFSFATHIAGGELFYERIGAGTAPNTDKYRITMRLFRQCSSTGGTGASLTIEAPNVGIYNAITRAFSTSVTLASQFVGNPPTIQNNPAANPCLTGSDRIACYEVGTWRGEIDLPRAADGYILIWTRYTRRADQNSLVDLNSGASFVTNIPGTTLLPTGFNSSAQFVTRDTSIVCKGANFSLNFSAVDPDGDSISYKFANPYDGVNGTQTNPDPFQAGGFPPTLNLNTIPYKPPYTTSTPLGSGVTLNNNTGVISGIAPTTTGYYVLVIVAEEWRDGIKINEHRKDFTVKIGDCSVSGATLADTVFCSSFTNTFQNLSGSAGITGYFWNFGDPGSGANNTSTLPTPPHTFSDTGKFQVKLIVTNTGGCKDSAIAIVSIYPTFKVGFIPTGNCIQSPFHFQDTSKSTYGTANSWKWDFGETTTNNDTSTLQHPSYLYLTPGTKTVTLIATCTKGCLDTITQQVTVRANPLLDLPFHDTLICSIDNLPLLANGSGNFSWISQPTDPTLTSPNAQNPQVSPDDTTVYIVTLNDNGCIKKDTITVNVLTYITVDLGIDTGMCHTDTIIMKTKSDALSYLWSPAAGLSSTTIKYPKVFPGITTTYYVKANLGLCPAYDTITIQVAPYPQADAGNGSTICYGEKVQLNASYVGTGFSWSPTNTLQNPNSLSPFAGPMQTTSYIFTAFSTGICPKPKSDTALVIVRPQVKAFAGNDTSVIALQPLQLSATGGLHYSWSPVIGLNNNAIADPIAILSPNIDSIVYRVRVSDSAGCYADDDIKVIVFKTGPEIFIPSAFTPNHDGKNEIARPVLVGMQTLNYFRVYNRWGQMVYSTSEIGKGWDGRFGGKDQPSGTYVYAAQAVDYTGKVAFRKGTIVLIR